MQDSSLPISGGSLAQFKKITETVVLFLAVATLSVVLGRIYLHPSAPAQRSSLVGASLTLPNVQWSANRYNVVLAISATCHFCQESAGFYHSLAQLPAQANLIVVTEDDRAGIETFLKSKAISASQIVCESLDTIGVGRTPTVLVVNEKGVVLKSLAGKQAPEAEEQFLAQLRDRSL